ncbi:MAG TPA: OmpA family protein [Caldimonas sp.]|jgi:outer membrane protein OmpA-like peptidoglycan-associated protein
MQHLASAPLARGLWILVLLVAGCAAPPASEAPAPASQPSTPAPQPAAAPAPAPVAAPFADAVARAGDRLLQDALATLGNAPRDLVIDPLIDASTGQQTNGTAQMGAQLAGLITRRVPAWNVQPLTRAALASQPLLLIGTLTAINTRNAKDENADAFRVCLVLIDLRTGKLVAKRVDRATLASVDAEPRPLFRDSPTWALDTTAQAYIRSCQGSSPGDPVAPAYLQRLSAVALINEASLAFEENKTADAYRLYHEARTVAAPDDLRVLNGLYATSWKTGRKKEAAETFARIVDLGLESRQLPIKIFFNPGTTTLLQSSDLQAQYAVWLQQVAMRAATHEGCLRVVGHTSRTGDPAANEVLSQKRAAVIKQRLERENKTLAPKIAAEGVGSREVIVGLGTDDLRDALDRRVEFRAVDCR